MAMPKPGVPGHIPGITLCVKCLAYMLSIAMRIAAYMRRIASVYVAFEVSGVYVSVYEAYIGHISGSDR